MAQHTASTDRVEHLLFMLARVTHELRTPLNAVVGFADLMRHEAGTSSGRQAVYLDHLQKAASHLSAVVSDLADLPHLDRGTLSLTRVAVPVREVACEAVAMAEPIAHDAAMAVRCDGGPELTVMADRLRMTQVLLNLLTNGVKHGHGTPNEVRVSWRRAAGPPCVRIDVQDHGRGLDPARMGELFEPFSRLGAERTCVGGSGLGLHISKGLARAMGGDIDVTSRPGQGSTFTLVLPLAEEQYS